MRCIQSILISIVLTLAANEIEAFSTHQPRLTMSPTSSQLSMSLSIPRWNRRSDRMGKSIDTNSLFRKRNGQSLASRLSIIALSKKLKRTLAIFFTSAMLLLGPISIKNNNLSLHPHVAHASSTVVSHSKVEKIVEVYIQRHMFNDDEYDPLESTYRETILDAKSGEYPSKLSSAASEAFGKKLSGPTASTSLNKRSEGTAIMKILRLVDTIQDKTGWSRGVIIPILFLVGCGIPIVLALGGLMSFSYNQKAMTERMAIERYGESVLDAEERVIIEDDEDDEYDYDNEEYPEGGSDDDDDESDDDDDDDE